MNAKRRLAALLLAPPPEIDDVAGPAVLRGRAAQAIERTFQMAGQHLQGDLVVAIDLAPAVGPAHFDLAQAPEDSLDIYTEHPRLFLRPQRLKMLQRERERRSPTSDAM